MATQTTMVKILACVLFALAAAASLAAESADSLDDALLPLLESHEGTVAAAVRHLGSGLGFAYRADERMPTASLVKLPVMVAAYAAAHSGTLRLDDRLTLAAGDLVPGSTVLDKLSPGAEFTLRDAVRMMMATSDNTATNLVIGRIGLQPDGVAVRQQQVEIGRVGHQAARRGDHHLGVDLDRFLEGARGKH